ncbi:MAG: TIGR03118 family protein [Ferruginibacter sp.]|nr:TIGR03118 family protein [Ferruginibacter sp.]
MKISNTKVFPLNRVFLSFSAALLLLSGCHKKDHDWDHGHSVKQKRSFAQINLVANSDGYMATRLDPLLINPWGLAFSSGGTPWIGSQGSHVSNVYNSEGAQVRPAVNIPSPGGPTGGNPTGVVFSGSTTDFKLPAPNNQPARFIFVGVDGILSAWNGAAGNNAALIKNNSATSAYTGLAIASSNGANYLYAANFRARRIDVFDKDFNPVTMTFKDPGLPAGYSPFNIQQVDDKLYVLYAKVGPTGTDQAGMGNGYVDIFNTNGSFEKRFASKGQLNSPWGIAKAPSNFFDDGEDDEDDSHWKKNYSKNAILVGNFGNGRINAYRSDGKFLGELAKGHSPIIIKGLWAISFVPPTATTLDSTRLYFTAGPRQELDGLFGYLKRELKKY